MNLQLAKDTLSTRPPKCFIELAAYEAVALLVIAGLMVALF